MKIYSLKRETRMPITLDAAWQFFSSPLNLAKITPPEMNFIVTSDNKADSEMYTGMIITYTITPLFGIKMTWVTEISHIKQKEYFVDEQRFGPYAMWHHQHHFKEIEGGVLMIDMVNYAIPYGIIGRWANKLLIANQVKNIFDYRERAIDKMFGLLPVG